MYITTREKAIIDLIIKTSGRHSALSLANHLNVSVRTIHRDLKGVEKILQSFDLQLVRNPDKGLVIDGKNEQIFRLIQFIASNSLIDQSPEEKKLLLLITLVQEESYKIQTLSTELGVSNATLAMYLDELSEWLSHVHLKISRKRGVGVDLIGSEAAKRKALANYLLLYFHEELIESLYVLENGASMEKLILHYFFPQYLIAIYPLVDNLFNTTQQHLADSDFLGLIVHICISMQRTEADFLLEKDLDLSNELINEYNMIKGICSKLETEFSVHFTKEDIIFLAVILKGSKFQEADVAPYDSVVLSKIVKTMIQDVSSQLHLDLTKDFSLYQGLLAHMEPSIYRIKQQNSLFNPLKEEIKQKYPFLFMAVKNSVEKCFREFDSFPEDEIAFIVLHFGSALVMREENLAIHALVICPTGIGTSKMLASRIKKEIAGINQIDIKSIKDIQEQVSLHHSYDLIISTVKLPFLDLDYILVSPLLPEDNIVTIKNYLKNNLETLTKNRGYLQTKPTEPLKSEQVKGASVTEVLQQLKIVQESIGSILTNFHLYHIPSLKGQGVIMEEMIHIAEKDGLLSDVNAVMDSLMERERKGGLGIPGTGMALFHCRNVNIKKIIFQIAHLEEPIMVKGMDGNSMPMENLLLLLAPEELSFREQEIVSLISTSLIENNQAIGIFTSSNEEMIRIRLETIFLNYLHTKIIKE